MKKRKNQVSYDDVITFENIYNMWNIIKKTCKNKKALFYFSLNLNTNINYIYYLLKEKKYIPSKYKTFMIFEPKPRLVMSQSVCDKIVNHFVSNYYLIPILENSLIDTNVATRKNNGSKYAKDTLIKYINKVLINEKGKEIYCLKIDISKYFYKIDHNLLIKKLEKKIKDKDIINLIKIIISETNKDYINKNIEKYNRFYKIDIPFYKEGKGLSIGAMSSQFLAIFYLSDLDHFIKEKLKCKYFLRYMDDYLILDTDKEKLKKFLKIIKNELKKLKLETNKKSNIYKMSVGFSFLGYTYKIKNNKLIIGYNKKTITKINKRLLFLKKENKVKYMKTLASYYGYFLKKGDVNFKMKTKEKYDGLKKEKKLTFIKEGIFYKTFDRDAIIMWYLFDYKINNNILAFGTNSYDKVIKKLNKLDIGYSIFINDKEIINIERDNESLNLYEKLSKIAYEKEIKKEKIYKKLNKVLESSFDNYDKVDIFLNKLLANGKK